MLCLFSFIDGHCSFGASHRVEEGVAWFGGVNQIALLYCRCMFTIRRLSCGFLGSLLGGRHTFVRSDCLDVEVCGPLLVGMTVVE